MSKLFNSLSRFTPVSDRFLLIPTFLARFQVESPRVGRFPQEKVSSSRMLIKLRSPAGLPVSFGKKSLGLGLAPTFVPFRKYQSNLPTVSGRLVPILPNIAETGEYSGKSRNVRNITVCQSQACLWPVCAPCITVISQKKHKKKS